MRKKSLVVPTKNAEWTSDAAGCTLGQENSTDSEEFQVPNLCFFSGELVAQPELFGVFLITCTRSPGTDANSDNQSEQFSPKERLMGQLQTIPTDHQGGNKAVNALIS